MSDRTVHAVGPRYEIVRYERAGEWFIEWERGSLIPCEHVGMRAAARIASELIDEGVGEVFFDLPGGQVFDRHVRALHTLWRCPKPIKRGCVRCKVTPEDIQGGYVVVSRVGVAHHGTDDGVTVCGRDATSDGWWWPL